MRSETDPGMTSALIAPMSIVLSARRRKGSMISGTSTLETPSRKPRRPHFGASIPAVKEPPETLQIRPNRGRRPVVETPERAGMEQHGAEAPAGERERKSGLKGIAVPSEFLGSTDHALWGSGKCFAHATNP